MKRKSLLMMGMLVMCILIITVFTEGCNQWINDPQTVYQEGEEIDGRDLVDGERLSEGGEPGGPLSPEQRLRTLEPEEPVTDYGDNLKSLEKEFYDANELYSIQEIYSRGIPVPFEITSEDDTWIRPVYSKDWHSTFMGGKYSDISTLVYYAQRNLFFYSGGLSEGGGLLSILGFSENWDKPVGKFFRAGEAFELWLINRRVKEVIRLEGQWLIVVEPALQGYQTIQINYEDVNLDLDEATQGQVVLFRAVTPDGYELERVAGFLTHLP